MAAMAALRPPTTATDEALRGIHQLLDRLDTGDVVGGPAAGAMLGEVDRAIRRLQAVRLALVAEADRADVAQQTGATGTAAWLATTSRADGAAAARDVKLATALDDQLNATRVALGAGDLSPEHAQVIASATAQLPPDLSRAERAAIEESLVQKARHLDPTTLRRTARRALGAANRPERQVDAHENTVVKSQEDAAWEAARFTWHHGDDGTTSGHFTVPTFAASILVKTIQQLASPRRFAQQAARGTEGCHREELGEQVWQSFREAEGDWAHRYGKALVELLEHLPTDKLSGKVAATVVVTLDADTLADQLAERVGRTDVGETISAGEARRLACNAGIVPAVLGGAALPLDLGRQESASSPSTSELRSPLSTTPAQPTAATGPMPGRSSTTNSPGTPAAPPTSSWRYPCAANTTATCTTRTSDIR